jgi:hypothetical protein
MLRASHLLLAVMLAACAKDHGFKDTEGRTFRVRCKGHCANGDDFTQEGGKAAPSSQGMPGDTAGFVLADAQAHFLGVCDAWKRGTAGDGSQGWNGSDCRIVTCASDTDCPPSTFMREPKCVNGLCADPSRPLTYDDVEWLCLSGTGAGGIGSDAQKKRHDLAIMACKDGSPCKVPPECRQP